MQAAAAAIVPLDPDDIPDQPVPGPNIVQYYLLIQFPGRKAIVRSIWVISTTHRRGRRQVQACVRRWRRRGARCHQLWGGWEIRQYFVEVGLA